MLENVKISFNELKENGFPETLIKVSQIGYYYIDRYGDEVSKTNSTSFQDIEKSVNPDVGYQEREKLLIAKSEKRTDKVKVEIERLETQKHEIQSRSLQQLLEEIEDIRIFEEDTPNASLIVYLLRNGYIDEDYPYYISLFHEGSRTKADQTYLLSIKNRKALPPNHKLDRIDNLLKHIQDKELGRKEIFNDSLTDYLIINCLDNDKHVSLYFDQLSNESAASLDYIDHYLATGSKKPEFINLLAYYWPTWWDFVVDHPDRYSETRKDSYFLLLLQHTDTDDLVVQDKNKNISNYILAKNDFLTWALKAHNEEKIKQIIDELDICFTALDAPEGLNPILDYIYENKRYVLNPDMIALFVRPREEDIWVENLQTANYSTILASGCTHLIEYIEENIDVYVADIFLQLTTNIQETQSSIIRLLNNETLSKANKIAIIKKENTQLDDIIDVFDPELWSHLLEQHRILPTWGNVVAYYQHCESQIDNTLTEFLNEQDNYMPLSKTKFDNGIEMAEEIKKSFSLTILKNDALANESYTALLKSIPSTYSRWKNINIENLSSEKVDTLIRTGFLILTPDNYIRLKEHFTNKHISLLEYYSRQFNSFVSLFEFDSEDIHMMLQSKVFSRSQKVQLIYSIDEALIIGHEPAGVLAGQLLYEAKDQSEISFTLLKHLIKCATDPEQKVMLMLWHWNNIKGEIQISTLLQACGSPYRDLTKSKKRPAFKQTTYNRLLAEKLKTLDYISSYSEEKNSIRMNAKQR